IGVTGYEVEGERVHPLRPACEAGVPKDVQFEGGNSTRLQCFRVLLPEAGRFDLTTLCLCGEKRSIGSGTCDPYLKERLYSRGHLDALAAESDSSLTGRPKCIQFQASGSRSVSVRCSGAQGRPVDRDPGPRAFACARGKDGYV